MYTCTLYSMSHIPVKNVVRHFLKHVGLGINKRLFQERSPILVQYVKDIIPVKNVVRHFL